MLSLFQPLINRAIAGNSGLSGYVIQAGVSLLTSGRALTPISHDASWEDFRLIPHAGLS